MAPSQHHQQPSSSSSSPYYSAVTFPFLSCMAIIYSVTSNLYVRLLSPSQQQHNNIATITSSNASSASTTRKKKKIAIVTGSNTGIGYETARALVQCHGYDVILACRSMDKARTAAGRINSEKQNAAAGGQAVVLVPLDLSSFTSIKAFADAVKAKYGTIHVLVNNAGRNTSGAPSRDSGGLDLMFQSNFLGHFALTSQLIDTMAPQEGRVINLSSVMHHYCRVTDDDLCDVQFWRDVAWGKLASTYGYSLSKLAAVLFTIELNNRYSHKIRSIAVNPGCVNSDIWRTLPRFVIPILSLFCLNCEQGATTSVAAAVGGVSTGVPATALYLQPYWIPSILLGQTRRTNKPLFPVFESMGPYAGFQVAQPRLPMPDDGATAASALWEASTELSRSTWPSSN